MVFGQWYHHTFEMGGKLEIGGTGNSISIQLSQYFLNLTCDTGPWRHNIDSDMRQGTWSFFFSVSDKQQPFLSSTWDLRTPHLDPHYY